jgi:hypothetical protein
MTLPLHCNAVSVCWLGGDYWIYEMLEQDAIGDKLNVKGLCMVDLNDLG